MDAFVPGRRLQHDADGVAAPPDGRQDFGAGLARADGGRVGGKVPLKKCQRSSGAQSVPHSSNSLFLRATATGTRAKTVTIPTAIGEPCKDDSWDREARKVPKETRKRRVGLVPDHRVFLLLLDDVLVFGDN